MATTKWQIMTYTLIIQNRISALVLHSISSSNSLKVWNKSNVSERKKKREKGFSNGEINCGIQKNGARCKAGKGILAYQISVLAIAFHRFQQSNLTDINRTPWFALIHMRRSISFLHVHRGNKCGAARVWQRNSDRDLL